MQWSTRFQANASSIRRRPSQRSGACLSRLPSTLLYELKQRPADMPVSIGVTSLEQAAALVEVPPDVHSILADFPEGSLTVVLRAHKTLDARLGGDNVAIRVVAHPVAKELLAITGPLTATSANRSGEVPVSDCDKAAQLLSASGEGV